MYQLLCYIYPLIICGWDPPQVSTRWSRLEGIKEEFQGKRINTFLGIPYAEPPLGNLRFRPPSPLNSFNFFQYYAGNYRSTCLDRPYNAKSKGTEFIDESEDCLYLNIWSPEDSMSSPGPAKSAKLRSVLVYLNHEATDIRLINGKMLASLGDVVVVTFNYRSGSFSRIQDGDNDSSEKAIYHDTKAALDWIRENIQLFGGNSRSITVLAEGWEAVKTGLALEGKHFDKLIITKGPLDSNDIESPIDIKSIGLKSESIGCVVPSKLNINSSSISSPAQSSDSSPIFSYNEIIECLKKVNNKTMIADYCPNVCTFGKFCHNLISVTS